MGCDDRKLTSMLAMRTTRDCGLSVLEILYKFDVFNAETWKDLGKKLPYPKYLDYVDLQSRLDSVKLLASSMSAISVWPIDPRQYAMADLAVYPHKVAARVAALGRYYQGLLDTFGGRFAGFSGKYARGIPTRPSPRSMRETKLVRSALRAVYDALLIAGTERPDGLAANFHTPYHEIPSVTIRLQAHGRKTGQRRIKSAKVEQFHFDAAVYGRQPDRSILRKFEGLRDLLVDMFKSEIGEMAYNTLDETKQYMMATGSGTSVRAWLKLELVCYWQRHVLRPRMMEVLQVHIPKVTDASSKPQKRGPMPTRDRSWMFTRVVWDSEAAQGEDYPTLEAVQLVREYARAIKGRHGLMPGLPGEFVDVASKGTCDATSLDNIIAEQISSSTMMTVGGRNRKVRSAANMCLAFPNWFNPQVSWALIYPACLNLYPLGTEVWVEGETKPLQLPPPAPVPPEIEAVKKAYRQGRGARGGIFLEADEFMIEDVSRAGPMPERVEALPLGLEIPPVHTVASPERQPQPLTPPSIEQTEPPTAEGLPLPVLPTTPTMVPPPTPKVAEAVEPVAVKERPPPPRILPVSYYTQCHPQLLTDRQRRFHDFMQLQEAQREDFERCMAKQAKKRPHRGQGW